MLRARLLRMLCEQEPGGHVVALPGHEAQLRRKIMLCRDRVFQIPAQNALFRLTSCHSSASFLGGWRVHRLPAILLHRWQAEEIANTCAPCQPSSGSRTACPAGSLAARLQKGCALLGAGGLD